jgi:hypothetical protein
MVGTARCRDGTRGRGYGASLVGPALAGALTLYAIAQRLGPVTCATPAVARVKGSGGRKGRSTVYGGGVRHLEL